MNEQAGDDPLAERVDRDLDAWRIDEARAELERIVRSEPCAWSLDRLALCLELQGDLAGADRLLERAARLDPGGAPVPPRFDGSAFDAVVERAVASLPAKVRSALERTRLVREPMPFRELVDPEEPQATPPDVLGLFVGDTLHELAEDASAQLPPTIYLFQRNLERIAADEEELREQIAITLFHEVGHLLGLDEDEVDAMGLG